MIRSSSLLALPAALLALSAAPARAQTRAGAPAHASEAAGHFDRGATFYAEGDYPAALIEFKRAYESSPNWQVLFNIGQSYFQLRDYANALTTLQRFAREGAEHISKDDRATIDTELPDLVNRVGRLTIASNLEGATVSVDDQVVGVTPLRDAVLVSAGNRRITATHEGHPLVVQQVAVGGRDEVTVHLDFAAVAAPPPSAPGDLPPTVVAQPARPNYVPTYVSLAVAAGGLAVGTVFGVLAMNAKSTLDGECVNGACPAGAQHDIDTLAHNDTIATIGFGVGAAGVAAAVVFWLVAQGSSGHEASASTAPSFSVAPSIGLGSASLQGRF